MFGQTLAITRNSFFESIRQPILLVVLLVAALGLVFSNLLAGFTMEDDQRMMIDLGLSTVFLSGALLAAFIATNVLNREIENKTALTVIAKPVSRPVFVLGKFLGVAGALVVATMLLAFVFALVELHGVRQTVRDPYHQPVLWFGIVAAFLGIGIGVWCNYFYGTVFSSSVIVITTPLLGLGYLFSLMFDHDFDPQPMALSFNGQLWLAVVAVVLAILVLTAIAIAASTRLGQVMTLCVTLGIFVAGLLSDWVLGRHLDSIRQVWLERASEEGLTTEVEQTRVVELASGEVEMKTELIEVATVPLTTMASGLAERLDYALSWVAYAAVPNFQVFWLSDALTQNHLIPGEYITLTLVYGPLQILVALCLAIVLFQRREVG
ncbi:MAG: ABC transporter permease [Planctomycetota bacterium]